MPLWIAKQYLQYEWANESIATNSTFRKNKNKKPQRLRTAWTMKSAIYQRK